ncbi:MAG: TonB-dependent receptor [Bacteroidota bacterium]|nr:TonB-dependent receptor [Bacteroidota bacterium]
MRQFLLVFCLTWMHVVTYPQSNHLIQGTVKDEETGTPLEGATVTLADGKQGTLTDRFGRFQLSMSGEGQHQLTITYVGYQSYAKQIAFEKNGTTTVIVTLIPSGGSENEVVVGAFLKPEKKIAAAAAIHVINQKAFERFAGSNPIELLATVPGIEYTRNGVSDITFNARGLHNAFNNRVLQIVDGRNSMTSLSGSLPIMNRGTIIKDDIERLEVLLGPQAAIYGPNAHNAVFNFIAKDPRKHPGTSLSTSVGSRSQFSTRLRHAHVINSRWAYKITGEHATGKEYEFYDSVRAGNQMGSTPFYGPAVTIPARVKDFGFKHLRGEGHVYYSPKPGTDLILSGGSSEHTWLQVTSSGKNQMRGVVYAYVQARLVSSHWYANIYNTWGSLDESYSLTSYTRDYWNRTHSTLPATDVNRGRLSPDSAETVALQGTRFKEKSERTNAEVRYSHSFSKAGIYAAISANFQEERPNGYGITLIDSFQRIRVRQGGGALQAEKVLPFRLRLVAATRLDHHQNFGNFLSPRVALVKSVRGGNLRVSWARAYSMPTIQNQYAGINRSFFGNALGILYLPNEEKIGNMESRKMTVPLKPEQISTWEAGFRGTVSKGLYFDLNYYYSLSKNFISPPLSFGGRVYEVNGIPVTHNPATAGSGFNPGDVLTGASFSTSTNYGEVTAYGLDVALRYAFSSKISVLANYSWFDSDITKDDLKNDANRDSYVSLEEKSMNAPRNRGLLAFQFENLLGKKWSVGITARFVEQYDFYSGLQIGTEEGKGRWGIVYGGPHPVTGAPRYYTKNFIYGPLGGFATVVVTTSYNFNENLRLNLGVTNFLNTEQIEFVGSPSIGRLIMAEFKIYLPGASK